MEEAAPWYWACRAEKSYVTFYMRSNVIGEKPVEIIISEAARTKTRFCVGVIGYP